MLDQFFFSNNELEACVASPSLYGQTEGLIMFRHPPPTTFSLDLRISENWGLGSVNPEIPANVNKLSPMQPRST